MNHTPRLRPAVRGLVIDHDDLVLLVKLVFPHGVWWVLPGGGIEAHEEPLVALQRELAEEVGLTEYAVAGMLWSRDHHFDMTSTDGVRWDGQSETVYAVKVPHFTPSPHMTTEELLAENLEEHRWWHIDELIAYNGTDHFSPPNMHIHIQQFITDGVPNNPPHIVNRH